MNKILGIRNLINITLAVMLIGGIVFASGFGISLYWAQQEVTTEADMKIAANIDCIHTYVDGQLQRVEDAAYTLLCTEFGNTVRNNDSTARVMIDYRNFKKPSPQEIFHLLSKFLDSNPQVCGIAVGLEKEVYSTPDQPNGFAAYVTNVGGRKENLSLGAMHDFREKMWYNNAIKSRKPVWSNPFRETSHGRVVTCFSVPLYGDHDNILGVLAVDINTETFRNKCNAISPFPNSTVTLTDRDFRFVAHPDTTLLLQHVEQAGEYYNCNDFADSVKSKMEAHQSGHHTMRNASGDDVLFYFTSIERSGWTIAIECPKASVFGSIDRMRRDTIIIAVVSILIMVVCFVWLFRRIQGVALSKAGMERELKIAAGIQRGMLPDDASSLHRDELDVCGYICPAKSVGGDLYDYFVVDDKLYFGIGDVSGKGVPASLFMAVVHTLFRNLSAHDSDPAHIMSAMNEALCRGNEHNMFCTMFMGVLDLSTGKLNYCNAGHCAPVLRRGSEVEALSVKTNIALGVIEGFPYQGQETYLAGDDGVFLFTDGVSEAEDRDKTLYGDNRVLSALSAAFAQTDHKAKTTIDMMIDSLNDHVGDAEQSDDITMLMISYNGGRVHTLKLVNNINEVSQLATWVDKVIKDFNLPQDKAFNLNLAIEEAVVNVMNYAYDEPGQPITVEATMKCDELLVTITDNGKEFDPTNAADPDLDLPAEERPIGGLGVMLVRHIASEVKYERVNESNKLSLYFK
ncbi:MAG: SpoIIE family protein phosphatase [Muribaculaceae bacterium]|nr:SpoIIE family protein phosphatase [Muribaculaceae bacterium]